MSFALAASSSGAASLQQVNGWSSGGLPSDVSMYVYRPDNVASNPPVVALIHYCGGTAQAVFGQAQGGGLVKAADQYGFILVLPSSGRCWDIVSDKTRVRDGGGDSHAVKQMVTYALDAYDANPERVYATGDSSGGMMTELLLALYPDLFKAGSAFAGMPAGCRGNGESGSGGGYSGACAGGNVMRSPEEWGNIARQLYPGYVGRRPRVQLFHGDADSIIRFPNHTEAVEQWSNVLGLSATATMTDTNVPLGMHQATRQRWTNTCGYVVLDAFTSLGGDHGPSDALFKAEYVVPFLGLDQPGPTDPEVAQCENGAGGEGGGAGTATGGGGGGGFGGAGAPGGASSGGLAGSAGSASSGASSGGNMTGGAGAAGVGGLGGGAGASSVGGAPQPPAPTGEDGGCACSTPTSRRSHVGSGLLFAVCAVRWRRRRAQ